MKILVVKISSIGDITETMPALHLLKTKYPKAQIDWIVGERASPILNYNPLLHEIFVVSRRFSILRNLRTIIKIRKTKYDLLFDFQGCKRSAMVSILAKAEKKYGRAFRFGPKMLQRLFYTSTTLYDFNKHDIDDMIQLLATINIHSKVRNLSLPYKKVEVTNVLKKIKKNPTTFLVGIHIGAGRRHKMWPADKFNHLFSLLGEYQFLIFCGPNEFHVLDKIKPRKNAHILKSITLEDIPSYINQCDLFVSPDSSLMHIAESLGKPVVCLMGPTSPKRWGPYRKESVAICKGVFAKGNPLLSFDIGTIHESMEQISASEVATAIRKLACRK